MNDTGSHTRFKMLLADVGYADIREPDKTNTTSKDIDLLVDGLAIEVKEMTLTPEDIIERDRLAEEWKENKMIATFKPVKNTTFQHAAEQANKQLADYVESYSTMIGLDLTEWGLFEPSIEFILHGVEQLLIDTESQSLLARRRRGVATRHAISANIKSILIMSNSGFTLCHLSYSECRHEIPEQFYQYLKDTGRLAEMTK